MKSRMGSLWGLQPRRWLVPLLLLVAFAPLSAQVNVWTWRYDNSRIGVNDQETTLTPANVNPQEFGRLFSQPVDGEIYAQPLYLPNLWIPGRGAHDVVFVATEHDSIYPFDADADQGSNGGSLWQTSFIDPPMGIRPVTAGDGRCGDITPEIGIAGTPDAEQGGQDYSSVVLRLHWNGNELTPQDQFIPYNADFMNASNEEPSSVVRPAFTLPSRSADIAAGWQRRCAPRRKNGVRCWALVCC